MYRQARRSVYELFAAGRGGRVGYWTDWFITALIALNVLAVVLGTVDRIARLGGAFLFWFEVVSVAIFTVEYVGRVWAAAEDETYDHPIVGRVRFASRPLIVVDLLAILPFYLVAVGVGVDLRFLRALRLVRFLRILKLARYSDALRRFTLVFRRKKEQLLLAAFLNVLLLVLASSAMYYAEHPSQPEAFPSIPATFYWGIITLTTVGYGDVTPVTTAGRLLASVISALGIGLFALPASILASGFMQQTDGEERSPAYCPHCGERLDRD